MARKKKEDSPQPGVPGWMVTYGDMMSLLLCFFVLLVSMSTMELEKFRAASASLKGALSVLPFQDRVIPRAYMQYEQQSPRSENAVERRRSRAKEQLEQVIRQLNLTKVITVTEGAAGIHIVIGDPALFDSGRAEIKPEFYPVLDAIIEVVLAGTSGELVRVEGHTDNVPINTIRFEDNWELSIGRALSVIRYVRDRTHIDPRRLRPVGCGEYHPVATNDTSEGRAQNRRVEIFIEPNRGFGSPAMTEAMEE